MNIRRMIGGTVLGLGLITGSVLVTPNAFASRSDDDCGQYRILDNYPTYRVLTNGCGDWRAECGIFTTPSGKIIQNKPCVQPVKVVAPPTPTPIPLVLPTVSTIDRYLTSNGTRSSSQMQDELTTAGYQGPWDTQSILNVYQRTTHQQVTAL